MLETMLFSKQVRSMITEFEDLLCIVEISCNSTNTKKKLDKHTQESKGNGIGSEKADARKHSQSVIHKLFAAHARRSLYKHL